MPAYKVIGTDYEGPVIMMASDRSIEDTLKLVDQIFAMERVKGKPGKGQRKHGSDQLSLFEAVQPCDPSE